MRDVTGTGCNDPAAPMRTDLPLHDMTGGNAWLPDLIADLYPTEVNAAALAAAAARAVAMLQNAATLDLSVAAVGDSFRAPVTRDEPHRAQAAHRLPGRPPDVDPPRGVRRERTRSSTSPAPTTRPRAC